ncbi:MAG: CapA family protein [bacterium]|nr:CapA family protein [bacterium]
MRQRFFLIFLLFAALFSGLIVFETKKFENNITNIYSAQIFISLQRNENLPQITLLFAGDIMLDRGVEFAVNKYGQGNWQFPFLKTRGVLEKADVLFGNLEGPISDKGVKVGSIYSFRANPKAIDGLTYAGFDILSVANNHILDYSRLAMEDTFLRLRAAGIDYIGGGFNEKEVRLGVIKEIQNTKIAYLAYTNLGSENWQAKGDDSGIAWLDEKIAEDIKIAKEKADVVIVSMHFGEEYQVQPDAKQKRFAHLAVDSGADLVVGHHPHVAQPIERYKQGYVAYSLGNFVFDQGFSEETMRGLLLEVLVQDGKVKEVIPINIRINNNFQPEIAGN